MGKEQETGWLDIEQIPPRNRHGWKYNPEKMVIYHPEISNGAYEIDLKQQSRNGEFIGPQEILNWLYHLSNKGWMTNNRMIGIIRLINGIVGNDGKKNGNFG